jgi:YegS/Rv2252/BmrU family lipid kinase
MTRALLIRNPVSRTRISDDTLRGVVGVATAAGWQIETADTAQAGHATNLARAAAAGGIDIVIVYGGDGTLNEALNGLVKSDTALASLRGGTANVWAKETHCDKDPVASMRAIVDGVRRRVDLGRANGRYFLLMAGIGLDAAIVPRVSPRMKRRFGALAYIVAGVRTALGLQPWQAHIVLDGTPEATSLYWMLVGNTRNYGGVVDITHRARIDDGVLDVALMHRGGVFHLLVDGVRVFLKRHDRSPNVRYTTARAIDVETPGIPVQIDGEAFGETPMRIECIPAALDVIVPRDLDSPLFSKPLSF